MYSIPSESSTVSLFKINSATLGAKITLILTFDIDENNAEGDPKMRFGNTLTSLEEPKTDISQITKSVLKKCNVFRKKNSEAREVWLIDI